MKNHRSLLLGLLILASLLAGCSAAEKQACPEAGDVIPAPGPDDEYVTFTVQKRHLHEHLPVVCHAEPLRVCGRGELGGGASPAQQ